MLSLSSFVFADPLSLEPTYKQDSLIRESLNYLYQDSFAASIRILDTMLMMQPDYWPALVLKAGVVYMEMADDEKTDSRHLFRQLSDSSLAGLDAFLEREPNDAYANFFKGTALGYYAIWEAQHGGWLKSISKGLRAGKYLAAARKLDSLFFDPLIGLGNLHYWRSAKIGFLRSLPLIPDQRKQGIEELHQAAHRSRYGRATAALALGWIYFHKKDYGSALKMAEEAKENGATGRQHLWLKAFAEFRAGDYRRAIVDFTAIREGLLRRGNQNNYNLITCDYYIGMAYYRLQDNNSALVYFRRIFDYEVSQAVADRLSKKFDSAMEHIKKITGAGVNDR